MQASFVNLRDGPASTAAVTDVLVTNTEVEVLGQAGNWCDVQVRTGGKRGFVACGLLAPGRLTLETIDGRLHGGTLSPRETLDWASRGFWVAPSLSRWFDVGTALTRSQLTPETEAREVQQRKALPQAEHSRKAATPAARLRPLSVMRASPAGRLSAGLLQPARVVLACAL